MSGELSIAESIRQDYEEEINKQAKVIQWYEKENRHNQEIIIKDIKENERLNNIINELEKWLKQYRNLLISDPDIIEQGQLDILKECLDKIKELKGDGSNE